MRAALVRGSVPRRMASAARDVVTTTRPRRRPADANRRILYVNPVLWQAVKIEAARDRRTVSGWVSVLCEKALGWDDEDEE
jgi:hypothetical protein